MGREQTALAGRWCTPLALAAYLVVALMVFHAVLPAPSRLLPYPAQVDAPGYKPKLERLDQSMVVATVARNARALAEAPWTLRSADGQCYPMPRAYTLGEHMFGLGLLAAIPWKLSQDPILSYNLALIATLWIRAVAMYLLALELTRSRAAAFFAGLVFALVPTRLADPNHSFGHGDHWGPLILLFLHRVIVRGGLGNALALGGFAALQLTESLYPLLSTGIVASVYGVYALWRHRESWRRATAGLLVATVIVAVVAWFVLGPYLDTRANWGVLADRMSLLLRPSAYLPGRDHFIDWLVLALSIVALVDRVRGTRPVDGLDPRVAFLFAAVLAGWSSLLPIDLPLGITLRSPLALVREVVPGLSAVRVLAAVSMGVQLSVSVLAGYGVLVLIERRRARAAIAVVAALSVALLALRFSGTLTRASFGQTLRIAAHEARPADEDLALVRATPPGPVVNLPPSSRPDGNYRMRSARHFLLSSYGPRGIAACYNSFMSPLQRQVDALAEALPERGAVDALAALGFEQVFALKSDLRANQLAALEQAATRPESGLRRVGESSELAVFTLVGANPVQSDAGTLRAPDAAALEPIRVAGARASIPIAFQNRSDETFRLEPLAPTEVIARWSRADGTTALEEPLHALLPAALAARSIGSIQMELTLPAEPGAYTVGLARAAQPGTTLGARRVDVVSLRDMYPPDVAMHRANPDFIHLKLFARPAVAARPPRSELSLRVAPRRIERLAEAMRAETAGKPAGLMLRWLSFDQRKLVATTSARVVPRLPVGTDAEVSALVPRLAPGIYLALLVPIDDPEVVLLGGPVAIQAAKVATP